MLPVRQRSIYLRQDIHKAPVQLIFVRIDLKLDRDQKDGLVWRPALQMQV